MGQMTLSWSLVRDAGTLHLADLARHVRTTALHQLSGADSVSREQAEAAACLAETRHRTFQNPHTLRASCGMPGWHRREVTAPSKAAATVLPQKIAV